MPNSLSGWRESNKYDPSIIKNWRFMDDLHSALVEGPWDKYITYDELAKYFTKRDNRMNESYLIKNASRRTSPDKDYILQKKFRVLSTSLCAETYEEAVELAQQQVNDNNRIYIIEVIAYVESAKAPVSVVKLR